MPKKDTLTMLKGNTAMTTKLSVALGEIIWQQRMITESLDDILNAINRLAPSGKK